MRSLSTFLKSFTTLFFHKIKKTSTLYSERVTSWGTLETKLARAAPAPIDTNKAGNAQQTIVPKLVNKFRKGRINNTYNVGSEKRITNLYLINRIKNIFVKKFKTSINYKLIDHVKDRPGHDKRYALNSSKINKNLSWKSLTTISDGLEKTFLWYLNNQSYFNSLKKDQIIKRLGKLWLKKE